MNWKREPIRTCPDDVRQANRPNFNLGYSCVLGSDITGFSARKLEPVIHKTKLLWKEKHPELVGVFLENYFCKGIWLGYALPRMRLTLVPHFGQMPCAMRRPESETFTEPSNWTLSLHFTQ